MTNQEKTIARARSLGWSDLSIECREDDSAFIYGKPPDEETYREFVPMTAEEWLNRHTLNKTQPNPLQASSFDTENTKSIPKPQPELAILDVINALRAVVTALTHWYEIGELAHHDAETLLNLLADAEAKLQLP